MDKKTKRAFVLLSLVGLVPAFFATRFFFKAQMQTIGTDEKRIVRAVEPKEPLEIITLSTNHSNVEFDKDFLVSQDWLKDFSITYRNKSARTLVSATIYLTFPETAKSGTVMTYPITFGPRKGQSPASTDLIGPGAVFTVSLDDNELRRLKNFIGSRHALDSLSRVEIGVGFLHFDDGSAWSNGSYRIRDPKRPTVWIDEVKQNEVLR